ncbi:MAG: restriction endonuclease subunit S [Pseudoramibacter sp.]|jgi:type I restriction enzyme S subunit
MKQRSIKEINEYKSRSINPRKEPRTVFEMYSVPAYSTGHPEYLKGEQIASNKVIVKKNDILLCKINPRINRVWIVQDESDKLNIASSEWIVIRTKKYNPEYLAWYFQSPKFKQLMTSEVTGIGGSLTRAQPKRVANYPVPEITRDKQDEIAKKLSILSNSIQKRKDEIRLLEELVKARFVEMFGDPIINSNGIKTLPMTEVCKIIDGDRGKNYPTSDEFSEDGYCLFLNAKNVTSMGFNFDNCMFITKHKDKVLKKGKLSRGDVVLTTRGTLGNLAFYTDDVPFDNIRINSGMVILRMKHELIDEIYFIEQFKIQLDDIKKKIASGSAQPQLPISTMNKIQILIPDISRQKEFASFVQQVDKSKVVIQKSIDKTQMLFDSLMQEYFS